MQKYKLGETLYDESEYSHQLCDFWVGRNKILADTNFPWICGMKELPACYGGLRRAESLPGAKCFPYFIIVQGMQIKGIDY